MATPVKFSVPKETKRLTAMYRRVRSILETQLAKLEAKDAQVSAAMMDVAIKSLRALPTILIELEKLTYDQKRREVHLKALETMEPPFPKAKDEPNFKQPPEPEYEELPFKVPASDLRK